MNSKYEPVGQYQRPDQNVVPKDQGQPYFGLSFALSPQIGIPAFVKEELLMDTVEHRCNPSWVYHGESAPLRPGDMILLETYGVTEARNPAGELFGEKRLIEIALRSRSTGPDDFKKSVLEAVESFSQGNADDDLTMLCVAFHSAVTPSQ